MPTHDGFLLSISHSGNYAAAVAAYLGYKVAQAEDQLTFESPYSLSTDMKHATQVSKQPSSKLSRIYKVVTRLILLLGIIGGLWVLVDKIILMI